MVLPISHRAGIERRADAVEPYLVYRGERSIASHQAEDYHHLDSDNDTDIICVYPGGRVRRDVKNIITHARIDESVEEIDDYALFECPRLLDVEFHDGIEKVGIWAFSDSPLLRGINLPGVRIIDECAFVVVWQCLMLHSVTSWKQSDAAHSGTVPL